MKKRKLKPQVKAIVIFLCVITFFIFFENAINAIAGYAERRKVEVQYEQQKEAYKQTTTYKEKEYLTGCVKKTLELLNAKDYEELYRRLDPTYKEIFSIDSMEEFQVISQNYIGENIDDVSLAKHYTNSGRYVCDISISRGGTITKSQIIVIPINDDEFNIILDDVTWIEEVKQYSIASESLFYDLKYRVYKNDQMLYVLDVINRTNKDMTGSFENSILQKTDRVMYELKNKEEVNNITLPAGVSTRVIMAFSPENLSTYSDDNLGLEFKTLSGTIYSNTLNLGFRYWD